MGEVERSRTLGHKGPWEQPVLCTCGEHPPDLPLLSSIRFNVSAANGRGLVRGSALPPTGPLSESRLEGARGEPTVAARGPR